MATVDILIPLLQALGLNLVLMTFCYIMVSMLSALGYDLYYYRGAGRYLPVGTSDPHLWRLGFHRCVRAPAEEETSNYYVLRDREGLQLTLRHKLLLLAMTFGWSDLFLLMVFCLGHVVQTGDLDLLHIRLVPALLLCLAAALAGGLACHISIRRLREDIRPRRIFMNNVGAWLERGDPADMVLGLTFFHAVLRLVTHEELARLVNQVGGEDKQRDAAAGEAMVRGFFSLMDRRSDASGRSWLFDLTQEGLDEYQKLDRRLKTPGEPR